MDVTTILSVTSNAAILMFLVWSLLRRRNVDDRIDRLASLLGQVTDLLAKNRSWEKSADEVKAIEDLYERKLKAAIEAHNKETLQAAQSIKLSEINAMEQLSMVEATVKFLPREIRSFAYAQLLRSGTRPGDRCAQTFFTSQEEVNVALLQIAAAEASVANSQGTIPPSKPSADGPRAPNPSFKRTTDGVA